MKNFERRLNTLDRVIPLLPCDHESLPFIYRGNANYEADKQRRAQIRSACPRCSNEEDFVIVFYAPEEQEEATMLLSEGESASR